MFKYNELYVEELKYVRKKGAMLRNVVILSAMIEAHIILLANDFLKKHKVMHKSSSEWQDYSFSKRIIENNSLLLPKELKLISDFRKHRKEIFHNLFRIELKQSDFDNLIKEAYDVGLQAVNVLESKEL